ncbi:hypothetical protein [Streptomyces sp. NPDC060002]
MARLSPLNDRHINFPSRYQFNITAGGAGRGLYPLRYANAAEDSDDVSIQ